MCCRRRPRIRPGRRCSSTSARTSTSRPSCRWKWTIAGASARPAQRLAVHMENLRGGERVFDATLMLQRREIRHRLAGRACCCAFPLSTLRVLAAIYWQALRLRLQAACRSTLIPALRRSPVEPGASAVALESVRDPRTAHRRRPAPLGAAAQPSAGGIDIEVDCAFDGEQGLRRLATTRPDLVLLDVMLPGKDGFALCREIRRRNRVPVIMLTARGDVTDRVTGLELGADDYIAKPFDPRELVARIQTRAAPGTSRWPVARCWSSSSLRIDPASRERELADGAASNSPPWSTSCCCCWPPIPGRDFSRDDILAALRGIDAAHPHALGGHPRQPPARQARRHLAAGPAHPHRVGTRLPLHRQAAEPA